VNRFFRLARPFESKQSDRQQEVSANSLLLAERRGPSLFQAPEDLLIAPLVEVGPRDLETESSTPDRIFASFESLLALRLRSIEVSREDLSLNRRKTACIALIRERSWGVTAFEKESDRGDESY
jgi:hypothetical protein